MISSTTCRAAGVAAVMLLAGAARAQPTARDNVAAQALFNEARQLVDANKWADGCAKFAASLALFPSASTALNIAKCHEHDGKTASAWASYHQALTLNRETKGEERRRGLETLANRGIAALEPRLSRLRVTVKSAPVTMGPQAAPNPGALGGAPAGLEVLRDGKAVPAAALGEALPVDPGAHEVVARAPGFKAETRNVTLEEKGTAAVDIELVAVAKATDAGAPGVPVWAWVVGAAGLGMAGAGAFFLADDLAAIRALRANCREVSGSTTCDPGYDYQSDNARKNRGLALAIGLGGAGLVALGVGVFGIVRGLSTKHAEPAPVTAMPWFGPGAAGAAVAGSF